MLFEGREYAQIALHSSIVVVADVVGDHLDKFLFACKSLAVVALTLQNAQKPSIGPLSMHLDTRDILCVIPAFSNLWWNTLFVY